MYPGGFSQPQKGAVTLLGQERMRCSFQTWQKSQWAFRFLYQLWITHFQTLHIRSVLKKQFSSVFYIPKHLAQVALLLVPGFCKTASRDSHQSCQIHNVPLAMSSLPPAKGSAAPAVAEQQNRVFQGQSHTLKSRCDHLS